MFDFGTFDLAELSGAGADCLVFDPADNPVVVDGKQASIRMCGSDSAGYKNRQRELARENADGKMDRDTLAIEMLVACTLSWKGILWGGKPLECTPENARKLYTKHEWLRESLAKFILGRSN